MNNAQKLIATTKSIEATASEMRTALCKCAEEIDVKLDKAQKDNNQALIDVYQDISDTHHDRIKKFDEATKDFIKAARRLESFMFCVKDYAFSES